MFAELRALLQEYVGLAPETQGKLFTSLLILFLLWLLRLVALRIIHGRFKDSARALYQWRKATDYVIVVIALFLIGRIWFVGIESIITYLGLLSAGLAIALQDLIISLAGWVFIITRRPFDVGDRIQIGDNAGDVIDVRLFAFSILEVGRRIGAEQSTGRVIHIPNGVVFSDPLLNYTQGLPYIWNEIPVMVTFESNWRLAKQLLDDIVNRHAPDVSEGVNQYNETVNKRFVISYANVKPKVYTSVAASGVVLTLRYLVPPRARRSSEEALWEDILDAFEKHWDIDFAYPTQREYIHFREKKQPPMDEAPTVVMKRSALSEDEQAAFAEYVAEEEDD